MLIEHVDRKWIPLGERMLAINEQTGAWLVIDPSYRNLILAMERSSTVAEVLEAFPDFDPETIIELLQACDKNRQWIRQSCNRVDRIRKDEPAPTLAVVKVAEGCNMNCSYCFIDAGVSKTRKMTVETARRILDEMIEMHKDDDRKINYCFHGGEPLLNMEVIRDIAAYSAPYRDRVMLSVQTNGTLITDEIASFFKENNINPGLSLDGPKEINDRTRHYQNGRGTFDHIMRGIKILQKYRVFSGIIAVMSEENAKHLPELLDLLIENRIYKLSFTFLMKIGRGKDEINIPATGELLFQAYKILLDRILLHNKTHPREEWLSERILSTMVMNIFFNDRTFMCMDAPCGSARRLLGFDTEGNYYACDTFINDKDFMIGSLDSGHIMDNLLGSEIRKNSTNRCVENLKRCKDCTWRGLCGGLCYSSDYYSGARGEDETEVCILYKKFIPYLIQKIDENPQLPFLIDPEIEDKQVRNTFISLRGHTEDGDEFVDRKMLELLLKLHDIKCASYETLYLCIDNSENVPELPKIISLLDEMRITYYVVLTQDLSGETGLYGNWEKELEGGTPDGKLTVVSFNGELGPSEHRVINTDNYRILSESRIQAIQINISGFENPLNVVKKLFKLRGSVERKIPFEILITTDSDLWEDGLIELALEEFIKEDCIVLTPSDSREDGGQLINILLKKLRENGLTGNVVLNGINSETLWKNNIDFLARQKDIHEKYLWIDSECLEGKSLEAPPFPRR